MKFVKRNVEVSVSVIWSVQTHFGKSEICSFRGLPSIKPLCNITMLKGFRIGACMQVISMAVV